MKSVLEFRARKGRAPISMISAHTHWEARLLAESPVDCVLVGDSVSTVIDGEATTFAATPEIVARHVAAVSRGLGDFSSRKLLVGDFPFLAARKGTAAAVDVAALLLRAGAHAVKIEGVDGHADVIAHLVESGVPVMGHLGLTPQTVHALGGYRVQGRSEADAERLQGHARDLQDAGASMLVLEMVPAHLASAITAQLAHCHTIGIGSGAGTAGQVLVMHDMLGVNLGKPPKFVRNFMDGQHSVAAAMAAYVRAVKDGSFPDPALHAW